MHGGRRFFRPVGSDGHAWPDEFGGEGAVGEDPWTERSISGEHQNFHKLIWETYLLNALAIDVPYDVFWHLTPVKLEIFFRAHREKVRLQDERDYFMGLYVREALRSTVCNSFLWKQKGTAPDQYPDKPFMQMIECQKDAERMSAEEKQRAVDRFFAQEKVRRVNWRRGQREKQQKQAGTEQTYH